MPKLIVDSNMIFSAILKISSPIGQLLLTIDKFYGFYAPKYERDEIWKHRNKLKKIAELDDDDFLEVYEFILKKSGF